MWFLLAYTDIPHDRCRYNDPDYSDALMQEIQVQSRRSTPTQSGMCWGATVIPSTVRLYSGRTGQGCDVFEDVFAKWTGGGKKGFQHYCSGLLFIHLHSQGVIYPI